ncbi:MAG TPA: HAD family phosphatase [Candidatus Anaerostipes avistercoris]|uniref:HAD family phosphatase n=1 Tax=Candidatus Anaerostipes avistercoris TaxID=2838462 RepID=A0A9D2PJK8_9FIRM|nr:HAD family phosphatase [Candidatus Anaerostipes avistercoris]
MLEAVIFDMDGVIVDTEPGYFKAVNLFLARYGKSIDPEFNEQFFGGSAYDMWEATKEHVGLTYLTVEECLQGMQEEREKMIRREGYQPIPGTIPLIRKLHEEEIPLAVASSSSRKEIEKVTEYLDVRKYFQDIVSGIDECEHAKPYPDVFLKAAEKLAVSPENCLVIEDSNNGALAASRAGMKVIGFRNLACGNQALEAADYVVTNMEDVDYELCQKVGNRP